GLEVRRAPDPCSLVIFGASGDLTKRKLFPALYSLAFRRLLPENFAVVGAARSEETDEDFKERMKEAVQENARDDFRDDVWELLADGMRYVPLDFADEQGEDDLARTLTELDQQRGTRGNRVYYLATPPVVFPTVVQAVGKRRAAEGWTRLLVAITAMEPPIDFTADSVRNEKVKVLRAMHTPGPKSVVRGQYGRGYIEGEEVPAYREEAGVDPQSMTETYVSAKLYVDNWRWADTPFYIRTGKRLARRETTIAIQFKRAPDPPF